MAMNIGEKIKKTRKLLGITQQELAESVCLDQTMISKIENNASSVSLESLQKIAKAFNTTLSELLKDVTFVRHLCNEHVSDEEDFEIKEVGSWNT